MKLREIVRHLWGERKSPAALPPDLPLCAGCGDPLPCDAVTFNGERWCSVACWYSVPTVLRHDAAERLLREADQLKRAREAGL